MGATLDLSTIIRSRRSGRKAPAYAAAELKVDLDIIHTSLCEHGSHVLARGRLRRLRRAVDCFGFHLASIDLRQNSVVHERTVGDLLEVAIPGTGYADLSERQRVELLTSELTKPRPLVSPHLAYSPETRAELAIFRRAAQARAAHGDGIVLTSIISMARSVSDLLELALLLKEAGLVSAEGRSEINIVPLFETIEDLRGCAAVMDAALSRQAIAACNQPRGRRR